MSFIFDIALLLDWDTLKIIGPIFYFLKIVFKKMFVVKFETLRQIHQKSGFSKK